MGLPGSFARGAAALVVVAGVAGCAAPVKEQQPVKAVYHLTNGLDEAQRAIGNVRNHLNADPNAQIVVVGNGDGIQFMLEGAKDRNGNPFEVAIQDLKSKGVDFRLCNNTLVARKIDRTKVLSEVTVVPSGVAEAANLQFKWGYAYLRP